MIYLLDTTAISDWMNEKPSIDSHLAKLDLTDNVVVCPTVRGEVLYGVARVAPGRRRQRLEIRAGLAFKAFPCEPMPKSAGDFYAQIRIEQERLGLSLGANDLWVAATAKALSATLVTRDTDYGKIGGLSVEDWST